MSFYLKSFWFRFSRSFDIWLFLVDFFFVFALNKYFNRFKIDPVRMNGQKKKFKRWNVYWRMFKHILLIWQIQAAIFHWLCKRHTIWKKDVYRKNFLESFLMKLGAINEFNSNSEMPINTYQNEPTCWLVNSSRTFNEFFRIYSPVKSKVIQATQLNARINNFVGF